MRKLTSSWISAAARWELRVVEQKTSRILKGHLRPQGWRNWCKQNIWSIFKLHIRWHHVDSYWPFTARLAPTNTASLPFWNPLGKVMLFLAYCEFQIKDIKQGPLVLAFGNPLPRPLRPSSCGGHFDFATLDGALLTFQLRGYSLRWLQLLMIVAFPVKRTAGQCSRGKITCPKGNTTYRSFSE